MATGKTSIKPSETLFVEWDQTRLLVVQGSTKSGVTKLDAVFAVERDPNFRPAEVGEVLKTEFANRSISAVAAVLVFPRELVTFTRVTVPNMAVEELPDLVRMQAATKLTVPVESVCLDFTPLPVVDGMQTRDVLLVTAPLDKVNAARTAMKVCGLEVVSLQVSSFAIAEAASASGLLNSAAGGDGLDVVLSLSTDQIEVLYLDGPLLSFSHSGASWSSVEKIEQAVRAEVSRATMAASAVTGANQVSRITMIGTPDVTSAVPDDISRRLSGAEVRRVDPTGLFTGDIPDSVSPTDLIGLAGAMGQVSKSSFEVVDLINPRKPLEKADYTKLKRGLAVAACVLALGAGWKWRSDAVKSKVAQTETLKKDITKLTAKYKASDDLLKQHASLKEWEARDLNWLDEMEKVQGLMGGTEQVLLKKFNFNVRKGDYIAAVDAEGFAKSRRDVEDLQKVMVKEGYIVNPGNIELSQTHPGYTVQLRIESSIRANQPKDNKAAATKKGT